MTKRLLTTQKIVNLSTDPVSGVAGEVYYNTTSNILRLYNGTSWVDVAGGGGGGGGDTTVIVSTTPPGSPSQGLLWFDSDVAKMYIYYSSTWVELGGSAGGTAGTGATVSDTAPTSPSQGNLWFNSLNGKTYVYYDSFWVEIGGNASGGLVSTSVALSNSWWLGV